MIYKFLVVIACVVAFIGYAVLMSEVILDYKFCQKRREEKRHQYLEKLPKYLKM